MAAIGLHGGLLLLLLSVSAAQPVTPVQPSSLAMVSLSVRPDAQGRPPPPALPSKVGDKDRSLSPPIASQVDSDERGVLGGCATLELVGKALVADPAAVDAVIHAPTESRSIAEAVVIWNAGWSDTARNLAAPLGPTRAVLERSLEALPADCLTEVVAGPRLVPVPVGEGRTMFVVIGSGTWSWGQLLGDTTSPVDVSTPATDDPWDWLSLIVAR